MMKNQNFKRVLTILFVAICMACNPTQKQLVTANVCKPTGEVELKLSDLMRDIKVVPLETNDSVLIGSRAKAVITNQFIIILEPEKVLQFSKEGKYIRTLAVRGNGPEEFNTIVNPIVVPGEELLYYIDFKDIHAIGSINLQTGEIKEPIRFDIKNFSLFAADSQGYIYGTPNAGMKLIPDSTDLTTTYAFKYNPQRNDLVTYRTKTPYHASMFGNAMSGNGNNVSFVNFNYSDTLFRISDTGIEPTCILALNSQLNDAAGIGSELRFIYPFSAGLILQRLDSEVKDNSRKMLKSQYLFLDKHHQPQVIKSVTLSPFPYTAQLEEMKIYPIPTTSGKYGYLFIDAMDFKILNPQSTLTDNDNPVIIFGEIR